MKLKYVAALMFRVLGAVFILFGIAAAIPCAVTRDLSGAIINGAIGVVFGFCLIGFNKMLARLFCKGLDDEPWPNKSLEPTGGDAGGSASRSTPETAGGSAPGR
jgi:hypothetical protein